MRFVLKNRAYPAIISKTKTEISSEKSIQYQWNFSDYFVILGLIQQR
jgi:hypothetical protein